MPSNPNKIREALDRGLVELRADDGLAEAVRERAAQAERRRAIRVLVSIGLGAVLAVTGLVFAASGVWRGSTVLMKRWFSSPSVTAAPKAPEPETIIVPPLGDPSAMAESNGLRLKLVSATRNQDGLTLQLTLRDLTGNRINDQTSLPLFAISADGTVYEDVLPYPIATSYNAMTHTTTFRVACKGVQWAQAEQVFVQLGEVFGEAQYVILDATDAVRQALAQRTEGGRWLGVNCLPWGGQEVRVPGVERMYLTNAGFMDEALHVQALWENVRAEQGWWMLVDTRTGEAIPTGHIFSLDTENSRQRQSVLMESKWDKIAPDLALAAYAVQLQVTQGPRWPGEWLVQTAITDFADLTVPPSEK